MGRPAFTFIDLFAGIGGFHAALSAAGGECVYAVEFDRAAARVYERNWGLDPFGDVTEVANDDVMLVPEHDVLAAGFPCQPFSKSGAQRGMEETRGTLYWHILKIIQARRPAVVLLENVRNLAGPRHQHEWAVIVETLRQEGYRVSSTPAIFSPHLLPRWLGGRPQVRERVFITATRIDGGTSLADVDVPPVVTPKPVAGWDPQRWHLAADLPLDPDHHVVGCDLTDQERLWIDAWDDFVRLLRKERGVRLPGFPLWADDFVPLDALDIDEDTPAWKADFLRKNSAFYTENRKVIDSWAERWGIYTDNFPPSRRKLEWQAQELPSLWDTVMHMRPSGIRAKAPTYLPALVAITQTSIVGSRKRRLSTREAARLQGLPDNFDFGDQSDALTYRQLGNGVSVGAVWRVLKAHAERDADLLKTSHPRLLKAVQDSPDSPDPLLTALIKRYLTDPPTSVRPVDSSSSTSGSVAFDHLRARLAADDGLRNELQWLLQMGLDRFNPSDRGNRWVSGGIAEWALALASFSAGIVTLPDGHNSNGHDLVDLRDSARGLWSVKSSYQNRKSAFIITNGLGGAGLGLTEPTVFLHPLLPGIVFVSPVLHPEVAKKTEGKGGETRLPFAAVEAHAKAHPKCVAPIEIPVNKGEPSQSDPSLDAVRLLIDSGIFKRLSEPFRIVETRAGGDVVTRLREVRAMEQAGELSPSQAELAITKLLNESATA